MTAPIPVYDIFDMYVDFLVIEKQHLPLTIETYKQEIRFFCGFLEQNALHLQNVSLDVIQSYIIERNTKKELSGKTINKIVSTLNSFFLFCIKEKHVHQNPLQFLSKAKTTITYPNAMTEQQVQTVLESIDVSTVLGLRDKAIFELIYACGLRIHEVVNLQLSSLFLMMNTLLCMAKEIRYVLFLWENKQTMYYSRIYKEDVQSSYKLERNIPVCS